MYRRRARTGTAGLGEPGQTADRGHREAGRIQRTWMAAKEAGAPYHPPANRGAAEPRGNEQPNRAGENRPAENRATEENSRPAILQCIQRIFRRSSTLRHQIPGMRRSTRSTRGSRQKMTRNRKKNGSNFSRSRTRNTSSLRSRRLTPAKTQQLEAEAPATDSAAAAEARCPTATDAAATTGVAPERASTTSQRLGLQSLLAGGCVREPANVPP